MASPLRFTGGALELLDQTRLPDEEVWLRCERPEQVADAIRRLAVRGAPAIGVAAAYGLLLGSARFDEVAELLASTRPTAVNLRWAIERGREAHARGEDLLEWADALAVLADRHEIPLHVVAPLSTLDPDTASGADIPIEERDPAEVTSYSPALNLAFDVTPHELVSSIVTEAGVLQPPYQDAISRVLRAESPA